MAEPTSASSKAEGAALIASPTVTWEVWTQHPDSGWLLGWGKTFATEDEARAACGRWPDRRSRRLMRVERTIVEETIP